uniref:Uncharacterized protein n=1 Tax=Trypanosoma vivax (strain Y486) TaxID=1055687 RepID=G0UC48_TRYVY|nr:hypothetical protein TVY486_1108800 [Trypanosoma vivax Y486]
MVLVTCSLVVPFGFPPHALSEASPLQLRDEFICSLHHFLHMKGPGKRGTKYLSERTRLVYTPHERVLEAFRNCCVVDRFIFFTCLIPLLHKIVSFPALYCGVLFLPSPACFFFFLPDQK